MLGIQPSAGVERSPPARKPPTWRAALSRWFGRERNTYGFALALLCGVVTLAAWIIVSDHRETRARAEAALTNLDTALERNIARDIALHDLALQATTDALRLPGIGAVDPDVRRAALFSRLATADDRASLLVFDRTGTISFDSDQPIPRPGNFADRPYFQVPRDRAATGLFISEPLVSRLSQREIIVFSRRLTGPGGSFDGVVASSVQIDYFRHLFSQLDLGPGGAVTLLRTDGIIIARHPSDPHQIQRTVADTDTFKAMLDGPAGIVDGLSANDGVDRLYAYRRVGDLPLIVATSYGRAGVFAAWQQRTLTIVAAIAILIGLAAALLVALRRQLTRRAAAEKRALASADQARRSEHNLAVAFEHLDVLFQHSGDAHFAASRRPDGRFAFDLLNRRAEEFSGFRADTMIGRTPAECLPKPIADIIAGHWARCLAQGEPLSYQNTLQLPVGRRSWETVLVPVRDADGTICRLVGATRDFTERKATEEALLRLNSTLEQRAADASAAHDGALQRASTAERLQVLGQLASGIAHDFNNILQSVTGCIVMLERRAEEPQTVQRAVRLIAAAAARGSSITNRLLAFSRTSDSSVVERLSVATLFEDLADILRHTLRGGAYIDVQTQIDADDLTVTAELNQLQTVLLNLATNARDAMPGGGILMLGASPAMSVHPKLARGSYVRLWVRDNGQGIDETILARVTEPFFTTKPVGQGTGLGLSMATTYAEEAGGLLTIDSRPGAGTTVSLWLRR